jgi:enamine deaminase RidA (YjgF/YER057c/UK114 family)
MRATRWLSYVDRMPPSRILVSSGSEFESAVGYSRAVRVGPLVAVSGTTAPGNDIAAQTREALRRIEIALIEADSALSDVIRTRIYVIDISRWRDIAAVHAEVFGQIRPAATMVEVAALIEPGLLVEIEADAYSPNAGNMPSAPGR